MRTIRQVRTTVSSRIPKTAGHRIGRDSTGLPSNWRSEILMRLRAVAPMPPEGPCTIDGGFRLFDIHTYHSMRTNIHLRVSGFLWFMNGRVEFCVSDYMNNIFEGGNTRIGYIRDTIWTAKFGNNDSMINRRKIIRLYIDIDKIIVFEIFR